MVLVQRNSELTQLYDRVMERDNIFLHAPTGMGKTHTLNELYKKLEGRRICFYVSVRGFTSNNQFLHQLRKAVRHTAKNYSNVDYQMRRFFDDTPLPTSSRPSAVDQWLENLLIALQSISQDFLFMIEDIDQWEGQDPIEDLLQKFFGSRNSHLILTAGRHFGGFDQADAFELSAVKVEHLPEAEGLSSDQLGELLKYTRGNTSFLLDLLNGGDQAHFNFSKSVNRLMQRRQPAFYSFRHRFTDLQWRLLKAIAAENVVPQPHSFEFLMNHRLGAASSVERALKNLSESKMILKIPEGWQISNVVFQRWLQWLYQE